MFRMTPPFVRSEYKPFQEPFPYSNGQWFQHHIPAEHQTSASLLRSSNSFVYPNQGQFQPYFQPAIQNPYQQKMEQDSQSQFGLNNLKNNNQGLDIQQKHMANTSAVMATPVSCPYTSCNAILHNDPYAQEHMKMFHSLAKGPGGAP